MNKIKFHFINFIQSTERIYFYSLSTNSKNTIIRRSNDERSKNYLVTKRVVTCPQINEAEKNDNKESKRALNISKIIMKIESPSE